MTTINNKVAIITGFTSGIGEAIAQKLSAEAAKIVLNSVKSIEKGHQLAKALPHAIYVSNE